MGGDRAGNPEQDETPLHRHAGQRLTDMQGFPWHAFLQFAGFCCVGVFHTTLDFAVYNLLTRPPVSLSRIKANCVSTSLALGCSFAANYVIVFSPRTLQLPTRIIEHLIVTCFSSYVIQNLVIRLMSWEWVGLTRSLCARVRGWPLVTRYSGETIEKNLVKAFAVAAGMVWNFFWYKMVVFAN